MTYAELRTRPRPLCSLTGLRIQEFEALLPSFGNAWDRCIQDTFQREGRQRAIGAGRKAHLSGLEDKFLFILMYLRLYPTQEVQGFLYQRLQRELCRGDGRIQR